MTTNNRSVQMHANTSGESDTPTGVHEMPHVQPGPTYEEIAVVAHQMYEEAGCPIGFAEEHWAAAENSLRQRASSGFTGDADIRG